MRPHAEWKDKGITTITTTTTERNKTRVGNDASSCKMGSEKETTTIITTERNETHRANDASSYEMGRQEETSPMRSTVRPHAK